MVFEDEKLIAVLPANYKDDEVFSHQGLTYGGVVLSHKTKFKAILKVFKSLLKFLNDSEIKFLTIKELPFFYADKFSSEINYLFFLLQAKLTRRDLLSVMDMSKEITLSKDRKEGIKRGFKNGLKVVEVDDFEEFWQQILIPNLQEKHSVLPVHSLAEIQQLKTKFPNAIRQFNVYHNDKIVAGTTIFETKTTAHSQYISSNCQKNELGSLDFLHHKLISEVFASKRYFDFGISNENQGKTINEGLLYWKESFGSGLVSQDFYQIETSNHKLLEKVLI
ncbi:GNAT family N-acetyltransferase [Flavobacterium sp.]|uniref:GNAT family N-acetyltransferase n=1 Tax=Flavobacterium sp. TaxID=239 RepID=UPI0028BF3AAF|nr:GNAT family N-acetyltransferase [Flavobacterium sp.]